MRLSCEVRPGRHWDRRPLGVHRGSITVRVVVGPESDILFFKVYGGSSGSSSGGGGRYGWVKVRSKGELRLGGGPQQCRVRGDRKDGGEKESRE